MEFFGEDEETARLNTPEMINTLGM
jgi:hypothetical protein